MTNYKQAANAADGRLSHSCNLFDDLPGSSQVPTGSCIHMYYCSKPSIEKGAVLIRTLHFTISLLASLQRTCSNYKRRIRVKLTIPWKVRPFDVSYNKYTLGRRTYYVSNLWPPMWRGYTNGCDTQVHWCGTHRKRSVSLIRRTFVSHTLSDNTVSYRLCLQAIDRNRVFIEAT